MSNEIDIKNNRPPSPEELQDFFNKLKEFVLLDLKQTDIERAARTKDATKVAMGLRKLVGIYEDDEPSLAESVREWVEDTHGWFNIRDVYQGLRVASRSDMKNVSGELSRMVKKGLVERNREINGRYRKITDRVETMKWWEASTTPLKIGLPLEIESWVEIYPKSTILVAGFWQTGKSAITLNSAIMNMDNFERIRYFTSEMGAPELKKRILKYSNKELVDAFTEACKSGKIEFVERSKDITELILPDALNIVDYLTTKEAYMMGAKIEEIDDKLRNGVAIIAIQKHNRQWGNKDVGVGGEGTGDRPRVYLSVSIGKVKIIKGKNWATTQNPDGLVQEFSISDGINLTARGIWHPDYDNKSDYEPWGKRS